LPSRDQSADGPLREATEPWERVYAVWTHIALFATIAIAPPLGCMAPIILWAVRRNRSIFIDDHGRELTNVVITGAILGTVLMLPGPVGWAVFLAWAVVIGINIVRGAKAAHRGEYFRYPMTWRLVA
jgi:uncharacterized Tic20 family protein